MFLWRVYWGQSPPREAFLKEINDAVWNPDALLRESFAGRCDICIPKCQLLTVPRLPRGYFQPSWENGGERLEENRGWGRGGEKRGYPKSKHFCFCTHTSASPCPEPALPWRRAGRPRSPVRLGAPAPLAALGGCSARSALLGQLRPRSGPRPRLPPPAPAATSLLLPRFPPASATAPQRPAGCGRGLGSAALPLGSRHRPCRGWGLRAVPRQAWTVAGLYLSFSLPQSKHYHTFPPHRDTARKNPLIYRRCPGRIDKGRRKAAKCQRNSSFLSPPCNRIAWKRDLESQGFLPHYQVPDLTLALNLHFTLWQMLCFLWTEREGRCFGIKSYSESVNIQLEERFAIVKRHTLPSYMKAIWESWNADLAYSFFNTLHKAVSEWLVAKWVLNKMWDSRAGVWAQIAVSKADLEKKGKRRNCVCLSSSPKWWYSACFSLLLWNCYHRCLVSTKTLLPNLLILDK